MSEETTTESFRLKIMRMFIPVNPKKYGKSKPPPSDLDIIDPLERFEKSILREAEKKKAQRESQKEDL